MAKKEIANTSILIPSISVKSFLLRIVGDASLISHAWSQKSKLMMLEKQQKKASSGKEIRRPAVEFADSLYWLTEKPNLDGLTDEEAIKILNKVIPESKFGFPTTAFKSAAIDGGYQQGALVQKAGTAALAKTTARGAFHIVGEFAVIEGIPTIREDIGRVGNGGADLRYRAEFKSWATTLEIKYITTAISIEQIVNLFNIGGFSNGVGDWRPAKDGNYGTFHVE